ncbi:MAG TPA: DUF4384 domain-containing protein [Gemmatimonadales bacterium]|jgi:hypothetical protein|nr:DUF4384 domain-containing protein [Gemmatimonadales bacterium]
MIAALLLPLFIAGGPAPAQPAATSHDDPPIQLWISNDRRFLPGESARVEVRTKDDGYLIVFHVDPDGYLRVLFPLDPDKDSFIRGGKKYEVRGRGGREAFEADGKGRGTVYAAVAREPFRFEGFVLDGHWDYRALAPSRLSTNPEAELNELVRRMAQGNFDYDILSYEVVERVVYASDYTTGYYGSVYSNPWCYGYSCGHSYYGSPFSLSVGLFFGGPYRRYYYDPYFYAYDPFYNPFYYDPYYYAPVYHPGYYYRPYYNYPHRNRFDDNSWYRGRNSPDTPYRFRGADGSPLYRDRNVVRQAVNTVYLPPISRVREPASASPVRRLAESRRQELQTQEPRDGGAQRSVVDNARRALDRPIEAHRARPTEPSRSSGEPRLVRREVEARPPREAAPARDEGQREQPRTVERPREEPRQVERPREQSRPVERVREERQVERSAPAQERGGERSRSDDGGRRHR